MIDRIKKLFTRKVIHTNIHSFEFKKYKVKFALLHEDNIAEFKKLLLNYAIGQYEKWEAYTGGILQEIIVFLSKIEQEKQKNRAKRKL